MGVGRAHFQPWHLECRAGGREVAVAVALQEYRCPELDVAGAGRLDFQIVDDMRITGGARQLQRHGKQGDEKGEEANQRARQPCPFMTDKNVIRVALAH